MLKSTYESAQSAIHDYITHVGASMRQHGWLDDKKPSEYILSADISNYNIPSPDGMSSFFIPFVEKIIVPPSSTLLFIGDIHGDLQALEKIIQHLIDQNTCTQEYILTQENLYIVCLGDYVNRHHHSLEVVEFLCRFAVKNPDRVFLVRGNHEYAATNRFFKLRFEEARSTGIYYPAATTMIDELEQKCSPYRYPDLLYWYDYLPFALYIGTQNHDGTTQFIQASHAGFELGWSAQQLLASDAIRYEFISTLDRARALDHLRSNYTYNAVYEKFHHHLTQLVDTTKDHHFIELYYHPTVIDCTTNCNPFKLRFGWTWNLFLAEYNNDPGLALSDDRRALFLGKEATLWMIDYNSTPLHRIIATVRGHQHSDEIIEYQGVASHFLTDIRSHHGMIRQWDGLVYTLGAAQSISESFSFLTVQMDLQTPWLATHWHTLDARTPFEKKSFVFCNHQTAP